MAREISKWIMDIIRHNIKRPIIRINRFKPIVSLKNNIIKFERHRNAIIAEHKTKSPSGLDISRDPIEYMKIIEKAVVGISILTEELYFGGSYENLIKIASLAPSLPILMKDFIVSENQIETAYNIGADVVLLISSILTDKELEKLYIYTKSFGLEVIIEIHDVNELEQVLSLKPDMIGVNARNLRTLEIDLDKAIETIRTIPNYYIKIAESGIKNKKDLERLKTAGANAFLIGTEIMKNPFKIFELSFTNFV